jgi:hypothetical protein
VSISNTTARAADETTFRHIYPGERAQVGQVRRDLAGVVDGCPVADGVVLLASELCANAVLHSRSRERGGHFTVSAEVFPACMVWAGVEDQGGAWLDRAHSDGRRHGLDILRSLAGADNWGISGDGSATRLVWFCLDWSGTGPRMTLCGRGGTPDSRPRGFHIPAT